MKYNLSNIARRANALTATMNQSAAWKLAWAEAKIDRLEEQLFVLNMKDRMTAAELDQSRELNAAIAALRQSTAPALKVVEVKEQSWEELMAAILANYDAKKAA